VPPPGTPEPGLREAIAALGQLRETILDARTVPGLSRFLVARFFYSDAVNTIIVVMAIVATEAMGLTNTVANLILLALAIVAVLASFGWGWTVDRLGPKRTLMIVLSSWAGKIREADATGQAEFLSNIKNRKMLLPVTHATASRCRVFCA